jgi:hypothetical protein
MSVWSFSLLCLRASLLRRVYLDVWNWAEASAGTGTSRMTAFNRSVYVHVDVSGNVYVADGHRRVRRIDPSGVITTFAAMAAGILRRQWSGRFGFVERRQRRL